MPICSYPVLAEAGAVDDLARRLEAVAGCDVARAVNRDLLLLVTDTPDAEEDATLRDRLERRENTFSGSTSSTWTATARSSHGSGPRSS